MRIVEFMDGFYEEGETFSDIPDSMTTSFTKEVIAINLRVGKVDQLDLAPETIETIINTIAGAATWVYARYDLPSIRYTMMPLDESSVGGHSDHFAFSDLLSNRPNQEGVISFNHRVLRYIGKCIETYPPEISEGYRSYLAFLSARTHYLMCPESGSTQDFTSKIEKIYGPKTPDNTKIFNDLMQNRVMYNANNIAFVYIENMVNSHEEFREQISSVTCLMEAINKYVHQDQFIA